MMNILNYIIHNILKFQIVRGRKRDFMRDLNLPFSFFEVEELEGPDIILNIGEFTPSNNNCYFVDHKYHIKKNYFYCKDSSGKAKWEVEIFGFEDGVTTINYNGRATGSEILFPDCIPQNNILMPLIEYKLCKKGYLLIHSAGISNNNNKGYVLAGRGGAFKSTLTMDFVRRAGFSWLGDDRVIMYKDKILSFPMSPISIDFKCKYLPTEKFRGLFDKIRFVKYIHYNIGCGNYHAPIAESSALKALLFIVRTNKGIVKKKGIGLDEAVDKLIENNKAEMMLKHFYKYTLAYSFIFPDSRIATYGADFKKNLKGILENIPIYKIEIPEKYNLDVFEDLSELIGSKNR